MTTTDRSGSYEMPRIGSACSGYGGLELGLITALGRGSVAWHVEYDKHPSAVLDARFPGVPNYGDITTTDWSAVEPVDWFTAGYPCQPFSTAGKRKGSKDERHLWPAVRDAIGVLRPGNVLLENVAGHLSLGLDAVLGDLAALGYDASWGVVRAADAGAPHSRARVFIVAADAQRAERRSAARLSRAGGSHLGTTGWLESAAAPRGDRTVVADSTERGRRGAEGEQRGLGAAGCVQDAPADSTDRSGQPQRTRPEPGGRSATAANANAERRERSRGTRDRRRGSAIDDRPAADTDRAEPAWECTEQPGRGLTAGSRAEIEWGEYEPAIRRWEAVTGRFAPDPTEPGQAGKRRLNPSFVEWLMGLPAGWVTDILPRGAALKALGNGVVPQQAALAVSVLHHSSAVAA